MAVGRSSLLSVGETVQFSKHLTPALNRLMSIYDVLYSIIKYLINVIYSIKFLAFNAIYDIINL
jgi:hypothetical protein